MTRAPMGKRVHRRNHMRWLTYCRALRMGQARGRVQLTSVGGLIAIDADKDFGRAIWADGFKHGCLVGAGQGER